MALELLAAGYNIGASWLLRDVNLRARHGRFLALVGPNGAGKSTLLRLMSGEWQATEGNVTFMNKKMNDWKPRDLALKRALLSQRGIGGFPFTSYEVVMMGRLPRLEGRAEGKSDRDAVERAMAETKVTALADRDYMTLSGGEARRVDLSRMLAQDAEVLLLDEPTNHLDPRHQLESLALCRRLADAGCAVIAALHDLNMASLFADDLALLDKGRLVVAGGAEEVLTADRLRDVYGYACEIWRHPSGRPWVVPVLEDANGDAAGRGEETNVNPMPDMMKYYTNGTIKEKSHEQYTAK